jgi:hypothetical protein
MRDISKGGKDILAEQDPGHTFVQVNGIGVGAEEKGMPRHAQRIL